MGLFGNYGTASKQAEIEKLINETMKATSDWERSGEKAGGDEIVRAATSIRLNLPRIISLYRELMKAKGTRNIVAKNTALPQMPSEIHVQMAIMGIVQFAEAIENVNPSFRGNLIGSNTEKDLVGLMTGY